MSDIGANKGFFKQAVLLLIKAKIANDPEFDKTLDAFAEQFAVQTASAARIIALEDELKNVNKKFHYIDSRIKKQSRDFYWQLSDGRLKGSVVTAHEQMLLHIKNDNFKAACKYLVVQAELIASYLDFESSDNLVKWVKDTKSERDYTISGTFPNEYLSTWPKLRATNARYKCQWREDFIKQVKEIRDYESHGYYHVKADENELTLSKIAAKWSEYFDEWEKFINKLSEKYSEL
jgi:hypothetical protein